MPALIAKFTKRRNPAPPRIGSYPQTFGSPPAALFADDVLSDDPERIRALVVVAGNPVITFPNTAKVEADLRRLELLVYIDLYLSDTATFGHYALPAATLYEKGGLHFLTSTFEPFPFVEWKPTLVRITTDCNSNPKPGRNVSALWPRKPHFVICRATTRVAFHELILIRAL